MYKLTEGMKVSPNDLGAALIEEASDLIGSIICKEAIDKKNKIQVELIFNTTVVKI